MQGLGGFANRTVSIFRVEGFPALIVVNVLLGISFSFVLPFNSLFGIDEVGMSNTGFGIFMTLSAISGVFITTYIGKISDVRVNRKTILLICAGAAAVGYAGYALVRDYYLLLFISAFILGIASSSFSQIFAYARETVSKSDLPPKDAPFYMNVFRMFFALAWTVGPALGSLLLLHMGFKGLYLSVSVLYCVIILVIVFLVKKNELSDTRRAQENVQISQYIFRPYIFANLAAFTLIAAAGVMGTLNMSQFVTKVLGGKEEQIGIIFSLPPLFEIPFMLGFGILATKIDNKILIRLGALLAALYFISLFTVTETWQIYPIQILSAATVSITQGIAITYFQDFIPGMPGTATALYANTSKIGSTMGFLLFGIVSEYLGYRSVYLVCSVFTFSSLLLLFAFGHAKLAAASAQTSAEG